MAPSEALPLLGIQRGIDELSAFGFLVPQMPREPGRQLVDEVAQLLAVAIRVRRLAIDGFEQRFDDGVLCFHTSATATWSGNAATWVRSTGHSASSSTWWWATRNR